MSEIDQIIAFNKQTEAERKRAEAEAEARRKPSRRRLPGRGDRAKGASDEPGDGSAQWEPRPGRWTGRKAVSGDTASSERLDARHFVRRDDNGTRSLLRSRSCIEEKGARLLRLRRSALGTLGVVSVVEAWVGRCSPTASIACDAG